MAKETPDDLRPLEAFEIVDMCFPNDATRMVKAGHVQKSAQPSRGRSRR